MTPFDSPSSSSPVVLIFSPGTVSPALLQNHISCLTHTGVPILYTAVTPLLHSFSESTGDHQHIQKSGIRDLPARTDETET